MSHSSRPGSAAFYMIGRGLRPGPARVLLVLLGAAALLVSARMHDLSLASLEDAFYAREAVEMWRAGRLYTVTWNGGPTHQHPPLLHVLLGQSFALFGENDFAARLPVALLALGTLLATYRLGALTLGSPAGATAVALLLATPLFVSNARRCMTEVPLTFWITATVWAYWEGLRQPWLHLLLGVPLGAALLTKSVLGLLPLPVFAVAAITVPSLRTPWRKPWLWAGVALGLALGASWPVHQALTQGLDVLRRHYMVHVLGRSTRGGLDASETLFEYPLILFKFYQPLILPGLIGAWRLARRAEVPRAPAALLLAWIAVPLVAYSFSSFRTPRFVFPALPPLALCAAGWLQAALPRLAASLARWVVPAGAVLVALGFWVTPSLLTRDTNAPFKRHAPALRALLPADEPLAYLGNHYWSVASPLLYYAERQLDRSSPSAEDALRVVRSRSSRLLLASRARLAEIGAHAPAYETVLEGREWVLIRLGLAPISQVPQPIGPNGK